jgi:hypothetical protein
MSNSENSSISNVIEFRPRPTEATKCSHCGESILIGDRLTSITVAEEKYVSDSEVEILKATATHMFCVGCARTHNFKAITIPRSALMTRQEEAEVDTAIAESYRDAAAKARNVDPASLTIEQITEWRYEQEAMEHGF